MRREQLEHAIRTACQIIGHPAVIVVGSQAILGSYDEDELPVEATMSVEVDVLPIADSNEVTADLADRIEGVAGEWSPFEEQHGFSIDGVDLDTAVLPAGWRERLVPVQNANTAAPSGRPQFIGWGLGALPHLRPRPPTVNLEIACGSQGRRACQIRHPSNQVDVWGVTQSSRGRRRDARPRRDRARLQALRCRTIAPLRLRPH